MRADRLTWQMGKLNEHPLTICDTGHNLAGWEYLEPQIASVKADTKHIVFGMVDDKDVEHVMGLLEKLPKESTIFYWTQPSTKRAIPVDKLYGYSQKHGLNGTCYQTIAQAFNKAKANAKKMILSLLADLVTSLPICYQNRFRIFKSKSS